MSLVGKVITVSILIMSLMFMGFASMNYATQRNWKALVNGGDGNVGLNEQLRDLTNEVRQRTDELEQLKSKIALEQAARRTALATLEVEARELKQRLKTKNQEFETLAVEHRRNIETLSTAQDDMKRLKDDADRLRATGQDILGKRDSELLSVTELTDKINQGEGVLRRLQERSQQLRGG